MHGTHVNIKWLHDTKTHLQNLLTYEAQLIFTLFNINVMIIFRYVSDTKITLHQDGSRMLHSNHMLTIAIGWCLYER